jgi:predicted Zn-dependent protease
VSAGDLAQRAVDVAGAEAFALVTWERSLMLRFAAGRPTQATAIDDLTVEIAIPFHGQVGRAATNAVDDASLADCAERARLAARAAEATGEGRFPGFDPYQAATWRGPTYDDATAELDPRAGATALEGAFEVARVKDVEAHGIWTAAEQE